jgi:hypothetical protein
MVWFSLASLAVVKYTTVVVAERAEGGVVGDAFEAFIAAGRSGSCWAEMD